MKNVPSILLIMKELQSVKSELSELKALSLKQTRLLESLTPATGGTAREPTPSIDLSVSAPNIDFKISALLHELGIPAHIKGYAFLREAIKMTYINEHLWFVGITKHIYPEIAKKYHTTPSRVERAIRHAIDVSWHKNKWGAFYGQYTDVKPTNSQLIADIVDHFKLENTTELVVEGQV